MTDPIATPDEEKRRLMLQKLNSAAQVPATKNPVTPSPELTAKENYDQDYEYVRKKLKNLADVTEDAIEHFSEVAKETNEPRAFEVLGTLLKNASEIVKGVMDNASQKATIDTRKEQKTVGDKEPGSVNNTTIFVGTTKDLLEKIGREESSKIIDAESTEVK